ncbi:hypothetical protein COO60DRAFT_1482985 [Scenedesmus sp. NREL 46B-D3]|nr:hypothetical protein COO60DRAFT_1482985 [Scenedesmus sp. NREL 46B-D3]
MSMTWLSMEIVVHQLSVHVALLFSNLLGSCRAAGFKQSTQPADDHCIGRRVLQVHCRLVAAVSFAHAAGCSSDICSSACII